MVVSTSSRSEVLRRFLGAAEEAVAVAVGGKKHGRRYRRRASILAIIFFGVWISGSIRENFWCFFIKVLIGEAAFIYIYIYRYVCPWFPTVVTQELTDVLSVLMNVLSIKI